MKAQSVAWVLAAMGVAAALAVGALVISSADMFGVAVMAVNGDLDLLIRLTNWRSGARMALAVLSVVAVVPLSAPLWLVRPTGGHVNTAPRLMRERR
jgi:hypothetical protein